MPYRVRSLQPHGPVGPLGVQSGTVTALSNAASAQSRRGPWRPHPRGPKRGRLLERERGLVEPEPETASW